MASALGEAAREEENVKGRVVRIALAAVALVVLVLGLRRVDVRTATAFVLSLPRSALLLSLAVTFAQPLALATRLWTVFPTAARPPWTRVGRAFAYGQLVNAWLPGRAGDVVKVVSIAGHRDEKRASAFEVTGVVLADKLFDVITLVGLTVAFAPGLLLTLGARAARALPLVAAGAAVLGVLAVGIARRLPRAWARLRSGPATSLAAFRTLLAPRRLGPGLALGCCSWLAEAASITLIAAPMGAPLALGRAMIVLLVLNVGIAIPVSFASAGPYEAAIVAALVSFGIAPARALAIAAVHHATQLIVAAAFAAAFARRRDNLPHLQRKEQGACNSE